MTMHAQQAERVPPARRRRQPDGERALADAAQEMLDDEATGETALQRAERATRFIELCVQTQGQLAQARLAPVGEFRNAGWSMARIAQALGLSKTAIAQVECERLGRRPRGGA